jgi:hypothetical protein
MSRENPYVRRANLLFGKRKKTTFFELYTIFAKIFKK